MSTYSQEVSRRAALQALAHSEARKAVQACNEGATEDQARKEYWDAVGPHCQREEVDKAMAGAALSAAFAEDARQKCIEAMLEPIFSTAAVDAAEAKRAEVSTWLKVVAVQAQINAIRAKVSTENGQSPAPEPEPKRHASPLRGAIAVIRRKLHRLVARRR